MKNREKLNEFISSGISTLKHRDEFRFKNLNLWDNDLDHIAWIDYNILINFSNEISPLFFSKFSGIRTISTSSKITDKQMFSRFLQKFKYLSRLYLDFTGLDQDFYDHLPMCAHQLNELRVVQKEKIQFDFIFKLKRLMVF